MELDALTTTLDALVCLDPDALADGESIITLHRQLERLMAVTTRATGRFDTRGEWAMDGTRTAAAWVAHRCRQPHNTAKAEVSLARALPELPASEAAWLAGDISAAHVRTLAAVRRPATAAQLSADEPWLVDKATVLRFHHFRRMVDYWEQHADPDGSDRTAEDQRHRREAHLSQSFEGLWFGNMTFDPVSGEIFNKRLQAIADELFRQDWADAKARLGRTPHLSELDRTPAERRADALLEMAIRSAMAPADGKRPAPLFTVLVDWETFRDRICELDSGKVVAPGALVPWLKAAWVERVVFGSPSRVLDVGHARRLFVGATRRAVEVRDRECFHETCDVPAPRCQVDHIVPFHEGGPTIQENGRLACGFHNRARTDGGREDGPGAGTEDGPEQAAGP